MADATRGDLYDAVMTALEELGPTGTRSFAHVGDFGGQLTQETISQAAVRLPAALLVVPGEDPQGALTVETTTGEFEQTVRTSMIVYLAVQSVRGHRAASQDLPFAGPKGLHTLASEVIARLNGLYVPGLSGTGMVHYAGSREALWLPGNGGVACVDALRFIADRPAEQRGGLPNDAYSPSGAAAVAANVNVTGGVVVDDQGDDLTNANPLASLNAPST